jgi:cytochrome c-type biogenesis protein CcmH
MVFWIFTALMVTACSGAMIFFALKSKVVESASENSDQMLYLQQKEALEADFENGKISKKALAIAETELARHFIQSNRGQKKAQEFSSFQTNLILAFSILFIGVGSFAMYWQLGSPDREDMPLTARQNAPIQEQSLEQLIARAEARIAKNPNDIRGWKVLAPIYRRLGRIDDAIYAYRTVMAAEPEAAGPVAELGEISFIQAGRVVTAEAKQLFERAMKLDSSIIKPQFYLALADFQQGDRDSALVKFNRILETSPADAPWRPIVKQYVDAIENNENIGEQQQTAGANTSKKPDISQNKQVLAMVQGLADRLKDDPDDIEGWLRLIRSYKVLGNQAAYDIAVKDARLQYKDQADELAQIEQLIQSMSKK